MAQIHLTPQTFLDKYAATISKAVNKWLVDHDCGSSIREKKQDAEHECLVYLMEGNFKKLGNIKDTSKTEQFIWICAYRRAGRFFMNEIERQLEGIEIAVEASKSPNELLEDIKEAMDGLEKEARDIISLFFHEGYSHTEIAAELGISPGNAAVRLSRAMGKLKGKMREMGYEI